MLQISSDLPVSAEHNGAGFLSGQNCSLKTRRVLFRLGLHAAASGQYASVFATVCGLYIPV